MTLGQKVDLHLLHCQNEDQKAKMAKQNENARFRQNGQKSAKMVKKGNLRVLLNSTLTKLGPKVDQHLLHCRNEDRF